MADVFSPNSDQNNDKPRQDESILKTKTGAVNQSQLSSAQFEHTPSDNTEAVSYLRKQVAKKDREVQRERALRRAAEKRELQITSEEYLDPYAGSNPSVNEELKERLSTKAQLNRLLGDRSSMERMTRPGQDRDNPEGSMTRESVVGQKHDDKPGESSKLSAPTHNEAIPHGPGNDGSYLYPPPGSVTIHAPWLSPHRVVHFDPSPSHSWPKGGGHFPGHDSSHPSSLQTLSPVRLHHSNSAPMHSTPNKASANDQSFGIPVGIQVNGTMHSQGEATADGDQFEKPVHVNDVSSDGLPFLIDELGRTKDLNKELAERLSEAEKELESLQIKQELSEAMMEAEVAAKGAALVEEIYAAQKMHDEAILARMRLANEERDEALNRARMSEDGFDSGTDVNSHEEEISHPDVALRNLVKKFGNAKSPTDIRKHGHGIVRLIGGNKDRQNRITSEEMRAIIEEKDAAVMLNKKLEREIITLKKRQEDSHFKRNSSESLKTELKTARKERDTSLVHVRKLKEELDNLKVYYSLHQSLSQESKLRDEFNNSLVTIEDQVKSRDRILAQAQSENSQLVNQMKTVSAERNGLVARVQQLEQENAALKLDSQKQERLVAVLRRKVTEGTVKTVN